MSQSKTIYGIEEHETEETMPEARGEMLVLKTDGIPGILEAWDFKEVIITMENKSVKFFPTEFAARRYVKQAAHDVGPSYLRNFKF